MQIILCDFMCWWQSIQRYCVCAYLNWIAMVFDGVQGAQPDQFSVESNTCRRSNLWGDHTQQKQQLHKKKNNNLSMGPASTSALAYDSVARQSSIIGILNHKWMVRMVLRSDWLRISSSASLWHTWLWGRAHRTSSGAYASVMGNRLRKLRKSYVWIWMCDDALQKCYRKSI